MPTPLRFSVARLPQGESTGSVAVCKALDVVDFSGRFDGSQPSRFTTVMWIRLRMPSATVQLLQCGTQFAINLDSGGLVHAGFAGNMLVRSNQSIADGQWHAVGVTYDPEPANNLGALNLFIDGVLVDKQLTANLLNNNGKGDIVLGANAVGLDVASLAVWNVTLVEELMETQAFGIPTGNDPAKQGLVAAWDFANGPAKDMVGSHALVSVSSQVWITPALFIDNDTLTTQELSVNNAYTMMAWYRSTGSILVVAIHPHDDGREPWASITFARGALDFNIGAVNAVVASPRDTWTHAALTWDGTKAVTYVDGVVSNAFDAGPSVWAQPATLSGSSWRQAMSIFNRALSADEVRKFMTPDLTNPDTDPTADDGCIAWYPLVQDLNDPVGGVSLNGIVRSAIREDIAPVLATDVSTAKAANSRPRSLLTHPAALAGLARAHGIDPDSDPHPANPVIDDEIFADLPLGDLVSSSAMDSIRKRVRRNFDIAQKLAAKGVRVTGTTHSVEGTDRVFVHHFAEGPVEVGRVPVDAMSPQDADVYTIVTDVFGIIMAAVGLYPGATVLKNFFSRILRGRLSRLVAAIQNAIARGKQAVGDRTRKAISVIKEVLSVFMNAKELFDIVCTFITGSWWSVLLTCLSIAAQIAAAVLSGMAILIAKLAALAVAIVQLAVDLALPSAEATSA